MSGPGDLTCPGDFYLHRCADCYGVPCLELIRAEAGRVRNLSQKKT